MRKLLAVTVALLLTALASPPRELAATPAAAPAPTRSTTPADADEVVDPTFFEAMEYRLAGPYRGGRVTAVSGVPGRAHSFFMGATGGGVWRTDDAGERWTNVSDGAFGVGSIGAIAVAPSDPQVVYVGTGSACPRGNVSTGDGIYKSTDGGDSWTHVGLPEAGQIGRIRIHPDDPDLVYVAALGHIFGPNEERGVYRSNDGGDSWERVLYVSETAGAVDLSMNPANPREIYAAIWRAERKPWTLIDGGEESGLYKTTDGGDSWTELTHSDTGLPGGTLGRIGVSVSPADPDRVYALVTHENPEAGRGGGLGGVWRSDDRGASWKRVSADRELRTRGWYYSHIYADPADADTAWVMNGGFFKSIDGGAEWDRVPTPHGDNHDLWINPEHPEIMVEGNDGGATVSLDGGETWSTILNQPTAEFYRVTVDDRFPYRLYGAQQDNSTISIPSASRGGQTPKQQWYAVAGGESGHIAVDPRNPDVVYAGNYIGRIDRYDHETGSSRNVILYPQMADGIAPRDLEYRFQWNAPIVISPHDPDVVYHTSQYVHRTTDGGMSWETISPDLTRNDPEKQELPGGPLQHDHTGVEVYNTIFSFVVSPHTPGVLWAGADDGLVHLSRDGGDSWEEITPAEMPMDGTVNAIEVSPHEPGRAFLAVYRYRMDDFAPYVFRTNDYGRSWELLTDGTNGIPEDHAVRVVREDPDRRGLLYAGTEFGMYVSFDDGARWQPFQLNLPVTPVTDLAVHRHDLVVATQGRSFWILDDLTPLHQIDDAVREDARRDGALLYEPRDPVRADLSGFSGPRAPQAPPQGALIYYWLDEQPEEPIELEILDAGGDTVRSFESDPENPEGDEGAEPAGPFFRGRDEEPTLPAEAGMNRFVWDLKYPGPDLLEDAVFSLAYTGGATGPPGTYGVRLSVGEWSATREFEVTIDPRMADRVSRDDLESQFDLVIRTRDRLNEAHDAVRTIRSVRDQASRVVQRVKAAEVTDAETLDALQQRSTTLSERLTAVEEELIQVRSEASQDPINFPPKLDDQLAYLYGHVHAAYGRPTEGSVQRYDDLSTRLEERLAALQEILDTDLAALNETLRQAGAAGVLPPAR